MVFIITIYWTNVVCEQNHLHMKLHENRAHTAICSLLLLIYCSPRQGTAQTFSPSGTTIIFYADPQVEESIWPPLFEAFHDEMAREESDYVLPEDLELVRASALVPGQEFRQVIEVRLIGRCDVAEQADHYLRRGPLGWVREVSGEIQPFVYVDCERLAQFLNPTTLGMDERQRREAMARAISRIAIHEWIHIDTQSARHESHGIRQAELSSKDLTAGPQAAQGH